MDRIWTLLYRIGGFLYNLPLSLYSHSALFREYNAAGWRMQLISRAAYDPMCSLMNPAESWDDWIELEQEWVRRGYAAIDLPDFIDPDSGVPINKRHRRSPDEVPIHIAADLRAEIETHGEEMRAR